jgi:chromosome segregation ATPase
MNLNASSQNKPRPVDTRLRALRRLSISPNPELEIEELQAAYNGAVAETHGWVTECETLLAALEAERERSATLAEQLGSARADAELLVESLAAAHRSGANKAADAAQRTEELAAAVKELSELRSVHEELRAHDHELLKRCGDLNSRVASKSALLRERTEELTRANAELTESTQRFLALLQERTEELGRAIQERDVLKHENARLSETLKETQSAHAQAGDELAQTTERFLAFVNEAQAERRAEVQTLSQLIDEAQQGRAWAIKHFLRKLWRK